MATAFDTTLANLGIGRTATSTTPAASGSAALGQDDFLTLMTAQLKNQDPFEPVDNTQMVAQMAQFSSLAGISEMNTTLKAIADKLTGTSASDALGYVGKTVLTEGSVAYPRSTGGLEGAVELGGEASNVTVTIKDASGKTLRTLDLGAQGAGAVRFDWDGTTDDGSDAGAGPFTVTTSADKAGDPVAAKTLVWAPVASVSMTSDGDPVLTLPGIGQVKASAIRAIG